MINLSTSTPQELAPGESIAFNLVPLHTGRAETHREGSSIVSLRARGGIYDVDFSANIGVIDAAGVAELSVQLDGEALAEGVMISTTGAAGNLNNVAKPGLKICAVDCCGHVSITNTGETTITVDAGALLSIKRVA